MKKEDVEVEIEKLKLRINELRNRASLTDDFEKRDGLDKQVSMMQNQIRILEKFKS